MSWKEILKADEDTDDFDMDAYYDAESEPMGFEQFPEKELPQAKALIYTIAINEGEEAGKRAKENYFATGRLSALHYRVVETADTQEDYEFPDTLPDGTKIDWDEIF